MATLEFLVSSALRAGQPWCLRRFVPASQGVFGASRRPANLSTLRADPRRFALRSDILILIDVAPNWLVLKKLQTQI